LSMMVDIGLMSAKKLGPTMANFTKMLVEGLAEWNATGVMAQEVFDKLVAVAGDFGVELSNLLEKQLALNAGVKAYESAVKAFDNATEAEKDARKEVEKLTKEYQELVSTRAPKREVREKKAALDAARATLNTAEKEKTAAETALDIAKEHLDVLKDQAKWQEKLLAQLIKIADWMAKTQEEAAGGAGGAGAGGKKGGAGGALFAGFGVPDFDAIVGGLDASLTGSGIIDRLKNMFQPVIDKWNEEGGIKDQLARIGDSFQENIADPVGKLAAPSGPIGELSKRLGIVIPKNLVEILGKVAGGFLAVKAIVWLTSPVVAGITALIAGLLSPLGLAVIALGGLALAWRNDWGGIRSKTEEIVENYIEPKLKDISDWFEVEGPDGLTGFESTWKDVWDEVDAKWKEIGPVLEEEIKIAFGNLKTAWGDFTDVFVPWLETALNDLERWWNTTGKHKLGNIVKDIQSFTGQIIGTPIIGLPSELEKEYPLHPTPDPGFKPHKPGKPWPVYPPIDVTPDDLPDDIPWQHKGGLWKRGGPAWLHGSKSSPEAVIPLNTFTGIKALSKALKQAGGGMGAGTTIIIEHLSLPGVTDGQSLINELQLQTIPGRV
jgi:hypothetical protein